MSTYHIMQRTKSLSRGLQIYIRNLKLTHKYCQPVWHTDQLQSVAPTYVTRVTHDRLIWDRFYDEATVRLYLMRTQNTGFFLLDSERLFIPLRTPGESCALVYKGNPLYFYKQNKLANLYVDRLLREKERNPTADWMHLLKRCSIPIHELCQTKV